MIDLLKILGGVLGTLGAAWLVYRGSQFTATKAKEGVAQTTQVDAQQSALDAWQELLDPYRTEVSDLRKQVAQMKFDQEAEHERREAQVVRLTERIDLLTLQLTEWKRVARVLARWGATLRDQVLSLGGTVPATPEELLTLQALEDTSSDD